MAVIPTLLGVSMVTFLLVKLIPGDLALSYAPLDATEAELRAVRESLGLTDPIPIQYANWLGKVVQGDLGYSITQGRPVLEVLLPRLQNTFILTSAALCFSTLTGVTIGIISAAKQSSIADRGSMVFALLGASMPSFWLGLILILVFGQQLGWFPISGMHSARGDQGLLDLLHHLVLPAVTLGAALSGIVARMTRSAMLEVLRQDYIRTARSKGLSETQVLIRHAFRAAAPLVVTVVGLQLAGLLGGTVIIETVFSWPGLGFAAADSILRRDALVVQGVVLLAATVFVFVNLLVDLAYAALDPRIRYR
jgi:peptide/nickel transport system permease protein